MRKNVYKSIAPNSRVKTKFPSKERAMRKKKPKKKPVMPDSSSIRRNNHPKGQTSFCGDKHQYGKRIIITRGAAGKVSCSKTDGQCPNCAILR